MKKIFISLVSVLLFSSVAHASMATLLLEEIGDHQFFSDVPLDHPNYLSIGWMSDEGNIDGYEDGTFKPNGQVNRAELAKMLVGPVENPDQYKNCFPDVTDQWFAPYVCYAKEMGWLSGYPDGTYKPANKVNRAEALKLILNSSMPQDRWPTPTEMENQLAYPADIVSGEWYEDYAKFAIAKELVDGQHVTQDAEGNLNYYIGEPMTRKEVSEMVFRIAMYELERILSAQVIADAACHIAENPEITSEEADAYLYDLFAAQYYTPEEADILATRFQYDDIVDAEIDRNMAELCGAAPDAE